MRFDVDHAAEAGDGLVLGRHRGADAGVVHEHVEVAVERDGVGDEPLAVVVGQHVAGHRDEPLAEVAGERLEPVGAPGRRDHRGAGGVQHAGEAVAEAARRAGDDGDPPVEAERAW